METVSRRAGCKQSANLNDVHKNLETFNPIVNVTTVNINLI